MTTDRTSRQRLRGDSLSFWSVFLTILLLFTNLFPFCHRLLAESLAAVHLAASLNFSMTTELLLIHLMVLVKMPTYGYKSVS